MRILLPYLFLILFLFPMAEQGIHAFEHEEEEHCAAYEETHLHEAHHDCSLCEYNIEPSGESIPDFAILYFTSAQPFLFSYHSYSNSFTHSYFSLRAPPSLG